MAEINQSEKEKVFNKFSDLCDNNDTIKDTELSFQLKSGNYPVPSLLLPFKRKATPVPPNLQEDVEREFGTLILSGHMDKVNDVDED